MNKKIIATLFVIFAIGIVGYFALVRSRNSTPQTYQPQTQQVVFDSQEECQQKTGKSCTFIYKMCDYIPRGKTFEEVCGKNFRKFGWYPEN